MEKLIALLLILGLSQTCLLKAQIHDHVLSFGFNTQPHELESLGGGRWLTVARGEPLPGDLYSDSIVAVVFDSGGEILQRIYLPLPVSEVHDILSATRTPDGGFATVIANDLCDAGFHKNTLLVFGKEGTLRWSKQSTAMEPQPYLLKMAPDGNLIGILRNQVVKYSTATGQVLWKAMLNLDGDVPDISDFQFYPGTEHLMAVGHPDLQFWEKTGPDDAPEYHLYHSKNLPFSNTARILKGPGGAYYTFSSSRLFKVYWPDLNYDTVAIFAPWIFDIEASDSGFYVLSYDKDSTFSYILKTDQAGQITDTLLISRWQTGIKIALQNDALAVAGVSGSGPYRDGANWLPYNALHLWLHTRFFSGGTPEPDVNVALVAVEQNETLQVTVTQGFPWQPDKLYRFSGGEFRVQLLNGGNITLDQAAVQIAFDWDYSSGVCIERPAKQIRYTGLGLAPGESAWLDFGDIEAAGQTKVPAQFCFWTSAPNERPDANHDDDIYCHSAIVVAGELNVDGFSISPNPASDGSWLTLPKQKQTIGRVFDLTGLFIRQIEIPAGNTRFYLDTSDWENGMYFLEIENRIGKFVVQHP